MKNLIMDDNSSTFIVANEPFVPNIYIRPFLFYDIGVVGNSINKNNIHYSSGVGIEFVGIRLIAAKRLDVSNKSWSLLFDLGGIFNKLNIGKF